MSPKNKQSGYLLEIPLIMMAVGILLAILLPILPKLVGKIVLVIGVLVWIGGIYYMIVIPGWQPRNSSHVHYTWSLMIFIALAALLAFATSVYVLYG